MAKVPDPTISPRPDVKALLDEIEKDRGRIDGMYRSMLNNPALTRHVSDLGAYLRFQGKLPADLREAVILYVARKRKAAYEWVKHEPCAREAGLPGEVIENLRTGKELPSKYTLYRNVICAVQCVLEFGSIPKNVQDSLVDNISLEGVIELVALVGFYLMIAGVIFAFDVPLPEGAQAPF